MTCVDRSTEYAMFARDFRTGEMAKAGRPCVTEMLCKNRFDEKIRERQAIPDTDASTAAMKKRTAVTLVGDWV